MFSRCLSVDGSKQAVNIGSGLSQQLENLAAQITDVQEKMLELKDIQTEASKTLIVDEQDIKHQKEHMENCIKSAKTVFSDASSYNGSILGDSADVAGMAGEFGSVLGLNDDQRQRVKQWIPGEAPNEGMFLIYSIL
jgi:hypothetical protein